MISPLTMTTTPANHSYSNERGCSPEQLLEKVGQAAFYSFLHAELWAATALRSLGSCLCLPVMPADDAPPPRSPSPPVTREYWRVDSFDPYL